jgi:Zn-dependent protease
MAFISIQELLDIAIMTFALGFIFSDYFKKKPLDDDPLAYYQKNQRWENIKNAALIAAPAIIFHELAHKFFAMYFGAQATLHAPYGWYALIIILKLLNFPLLFFVGGYVSHTPLPALASAVVSLAGPLTNVGVWLATTVIVKKQLINRKYYPILIPIGKINLFLAIFNMIPIPGFDGANAIINLLRAFA